MSSACCSTPEFMLGIPSQTYTAGVCAQLCIASMICGQYKIVDDKYCMGSQCRNCKGWRPTIREKPCNSSGACLACPEFNRKSEIERIRSNSSMLFLSSTCSFASLQPSEEKIKGSYNFKKQRSITVYGMSNTLSGSFVSSVPTTIIGPLTIEPPKKTVPGILSTSNYLNVQNVRSTSDVAAIVTDAKSLRFTSLNSYGSTYTAAFAHIAGTVDIQDCKANHPIVSQLVQGDQVRYSVQGCDIIDLAALLSVFGYEYEVKFIQGSYNYDYTDQYNIIKYASIAIVVLILSIVIVYGDQMYRVGKVFSKTSLSK